MLVFNFLIPYFASLSVFCERERENSTKKIPPPLHQGEGIFCDATVPAAVLRWADGGWGEGAVENLGSEEILFLSFSAFLHGIES